MMVEQAGLNTVNLQRQVATRIMPLRMFRSIDMKNILQIEVCMK